MMKQKTNTIKLKKILQQEISMDVHKSPVVNWFKTEPVKTKTCKIASDEVIVKTISRDTVVCSLIVSVLVNVFMLIGWIYYQIDPSSRLAILQLFFG